MITFESLSTTFELNIVIWGSWGSSKNWLLPKTKLPLANLACPNPWSALYQWFSTQITPRPVFLTGKFQRPAIEKLKEQSSFVFCMLSSRVLLSHFKQESYKNSLFYSFLIFKITFSKIFGQFQWFKIFQLEMD
jgi:hypothetical protein